MYLAVTHNMVEVVKMLREKGDDLFQKYEGGKTLLHLAAQTNKADMVGYLVD